MSRADLMPGYLAVAERDWIVIDGAVSLKGWYESYHGDRARFAVTLGYETAVNGRAIPDLDLPYAGASRVSNLLRRGSAFVWAALHTAIRDVPGARLAGYVTVSPTLMDPDLITGNMTFCAVRPGEAPYIDPGRVGDAIVVALFSEDCVRPLPENR